MSSSRTRSFCIYFFGDPSTFTSRSTSFFRRITVDKPPGRDQLTVGHVKKEAGKAVQLLPSSLSIFGLFLGDDLGLPRRYCSNEAIVPTTVTEFSFQLVSFDEDIEKGVLFKDEKAMELIYWEIKNKWGNFGFPYLAQVECNKGFFKMYKNVTQTTRLTSSNILSFLQALRMCCPIFTMHYYHVRHIEARLKDKDDPGQDVGESKTKKLTSLSHCHTSDLFVADKVATPRSIRQQSRMKFHQCQKTDSDPVCRSPTNVTVALNREQLVVLDAVGRMELLSLDWELIKSLYKNRNKGLFVIEFLAKPEKSRYITIKTDCSSFLFSISKHIITLRSSAPVEEKDLPLILESKEELMNPLFHNVHVNEKMLANLVAEQFAEIPNLEDEEGLYAQPQTFDSSVCSSMDVMQVPPGIQGNCASGLDVSRKDEMYIIV